MRAVRLRVCEAPYVRDASHRTAALFLQNGLLLLRLVLREAARQLERQRERVRIKRFAQALPM